MNCISCAAKQADMARTGSVIRYALASRRSLAYTAKTGPFENQINRLKLDLQFGPSGSPHIKMRACRWLFYSFSFQCTVLCIQRLGKTNAFKFHGKSHLTFNTCRILVSIASCYFSICLFNFTKLQLEFFLIAPAFGLTKRTAIRYNVVVHSLYTKCKV